MNVFALGHGFMNTADSTTLVFNTKTYVLPGTMLDGRGIQSLVDGGNYNEGRTDDATSVQEHIVQGVPCCEGEQLFTRALPGYRFDARH
jgi:hypothetical protein